MYFNEEHFLTITMFDP